VNFSRSFQSNQNGADDINPVLSSVNNTVTAYVPSIQIEGIAAGLQYLHENKVIHGDVKSVCSISPVTAGLTFIDLAG
jgi:serine/threonine protein kinase